MIETLHLFRPLDQKLISLLESLSPDDWEKKTVAGTWTVKDVATHLLDGNVRAISIIRDKIILKPGDPINSYKEVVDYLNSLNADWVKATKRMSPRLLVEMLRFTQEPYIASLESLDLNEPAMFSVGWAGESVSVNWFHIAREFTEKWHHQQQIRHAVNQPGILTNEYYLPVLHTFMRALPHHYRLLKSSPGKKIKITVTDPGSTWMLMKKNEGWELMTQPDQDADTSVTIPAEVSWQLFTKAVNYEAVKNLIKIQGERLLADPVLRMITVMA